MEIHFCYGQLVTKTLSFCVGRGLTISKSITSRPRAHRRSCRDQRDRPILLEVFVGPWDSVETELMNLESIVSPRPGSRLGLHSFKRLGDLLIGRDWPPVQDCE